MKTVRKIILLLFVMLCIGANTKANAANVLDDYIEVYENTEFVLTSTLVKPKESGIIDGNETRLFEIINRYEKAYSVEDEYWDKTLIETRSKDMADFIVCILKNSFDE